MSWDTNSMLTKIGIPVAVLLLVWTVVDELRARRTKPAPVHVAPYEAFAGGHPVPPLPDQAFGARPIDYILRETALRESPTKPEVPGA